MGENNGVPLGGFPADDSTLTRAERCEKIREHAHEVTIHILGLCERPYGLAVGMVEAMKIVHEAFDDAIDSLAATAQEGLADGLLYAVVYASDAIGRAIDALDRDEPGPGDVPEEECLRHDRTDG